MIQSKFQLILTEASGNYATPDITITDSLQTTFAIQNVSDISQRKDVLAQAITFPGTKNNDRIFNNLFSLNRDADSTLAETLFYNYSPVVGVRAVLYENNYPIVSGVLTIQKISKDANGSYTATGIITGNLVNFFGKLRDTLIQDLQLFNQDINYTWDEIKNSWVFSDQNKYIFPSIDYGNGIIPARDIFDIRNFRPGIYVRQYLKSILGLYGYRYKSTFIDSELFNRAFIPYSEIYFGKTITGDVIAFNGGAKGEISMNRDDASTALNGVFYDDYALNAYITLTEQNVHGVNGGWGRRTVLNDRPATVMTFNKASSTGATLTFDIDVFSHAASTNIYVQLFQFYKGGDGIYPEFNADNPISEVNLSYGTEHRFEWVNLTGTLQLPVDNYPKDWAFGIVITTVTDRGDDCEMRQNSTKVTISNPDVSVGSIFSYDIGDTFNLNDATPRDTKAQDFLKSIFTYFDIYAIENPEDDQELIIEPYDLFYSKMLDPARFAIDWTKKVDTNTLDININTNLPKTYAFKMAEDSDFYATLYKKTYGVNYGDYTVDNSIGTADELDITGIFAATVMVTEDKDDKTLPAIWSGELLAKTVFKSKPRILFNNGISSCLPYDVCLTKGGGDSISYEVRVDNVQVYNISSTILSIGGVDKFNLLFGLPKAVYYKVTTSVFDVPTLYSLYARQLIELDDINIFTLDLDVHLRDYDINKLDLSTPIFISTPQGIAYFKVMTVQYFNSDEVSKVTLQKIILT